ncbi:hypothetical protein U1Q18_008354 [Sarracenia purpurea var. burkii]
MAKAAGRSKKSWIEVAPAPLISPAKVSNSPGLETIAEEISEKSDQELSIFFSLLSGLDLGRVLLGL